jgi:hypothetical protein
LYNNNIVLIYFNMSNISSIFTVFSVLVGLLLFGIWSNIAVNAQQPLASPPAASSSGTTISPELKAKMCDPSNPSLKVVNTTESRICGIPKSVKNTTTTAATPTTSVVSALQPAAAVANPKHQKMTASNHSNTITSTVNQLPKQTSKTIIAGKGTTATLAPVKNVSNKSLSLPSSESSIAPQVNTMNKKQQQQQILPTVGNVTAGQNHTFAATPTPVIPGKLTYLGYKGSSATSDHISSTSKDKHSSDTKPSSTGSSSSGSSSTSKDKHSSDTKPSSTGSSSSSSGSSSTSKDKHSSHVKSSVHNGDSSKSSSTMKNDILLAITKGLNSDSYSSDNGENSFAGDSFFANGDSAASASSSTSN